MVVAVVLDSLRQAQWAVWAVMVALVVVLLLVQAHLAVSLGKEIVEVLLMVPLVTQVVEVVALGKPDYQPLRARIRVTAAMVLRLR